MRVTLTETADGRYVVLEDTETGATWPYPVSDRATAESDRDRAEADPRYMRNRTMAIQNGEA